MNGTDLLAEFRTTGSEQAFRDLVGRYTNLVYSVANRRLANFSLAQEVTQIVFVRLAKAAPKVRDDGQLAAWLHRTTVHVAIDLWRSEFRRRVREEQAVAMQTDRTENAAWDDIAPVLDEALNELDEADRQTLLLRFFDQKKMRDLGATFGVSEDAAKMRVSRAMERLRSQLSSRGVSCGVRALAAVLTERSVEAAPSALVAALMCLSIPAPTSIGAGAGFFGPILQVSRTKLVTGLAATVLVGVVTFSLFRSPGSANRVAALDTPQTAAPNVEQNPRAATTAAQEIPPAVTEREPDPLKLLQTVAQARLQISSGSMEFQLATEGLQNRHMETNHLRLSALFDGQKLRWEQVGREYRYTAMAPASEAQEARMKQEGLDRATAVRAGLLQGFEAHYVTAYDGAALLTYRETDGQSSGTVIDAPNKGSRQFIFDPRCLGLSAYPGVNGTIESCLGYREAKSIKLVGRESVDGVPAWHVQVKSKHDASLDFWMDAAQPGRVLQHATGRDVVRSKYDGAVVADPLPTEVISTENRNGSPWFIQRFIRSGAQFNVPVDPASWTLAGLGMAVGTTVSDVRISRSIGYWTGAGLSETPPIRGTRTQKGPEPQPPPRLAELLAVLENDPASSVALEAAAWILLNTPDGPEVDKAAEVILREHTQDTNLVCLCKQLERVRHRCATNLLAAILANNPSAEVKAQACFVLATMRKEEAMFGLNKKATAEAEKLFERVITEFARSGPSGAELARRTKPELHELRHLTIGKPAPETVGEDLDGQKRNFGDYRGNVVVLVFWCCGYSEAPEHRKFLESMAGKPVVLIGVSGDNQLARAREAVEKYQISWPTIWDGRDRPIHEAWNVNKWLTTIVLDAKGVIRYRDVRGRELEAAVDALLAESSR